MLNKSWQYKKFHRAVFKLEAPKAVIKGVFRRSYCCYGNLLRSKKTKSRSQMGRKYFDTMIVVSSEND